MPAHLPGRASCLCTAGMEVTWTHLCLPEAGVVYHLLCVHGVSTRALSPQNLLTERSALSGLWRGVNPLSMSSLSAPPWSSLILLCFLTFLWDQRMKKVGEEVQYLVKFHKLSLKIVTSSTCKWNYINLIYDIFVSFCIKQLLC